MAIVQNPIIGASSGKAGGMIFSRVFSNNIIRANPSHYRDNPGTVQLQKRADITVYSKLLSVAIPYLPAFFSQPPKGMSYYSYSIGFFMRNKGIETTVGLSSVTSVTMQRGTIHNVVIDNIQKNIDGNAIFFVDPSNTIFVNNPAKFYLLALYPNTCEVEYREFDMTTNAFQVDLTPSALVLAGDPVFLLHSKKTISKFKSGSELSKTVR
ncbi:MAG: hypothetical protein WCJ74_00970 [bacterium]